MLEAVRRKHRSASHGCQDPNYDHVFGNAMFAEAGLTEFLAPQNCVMEIDQWATCSVGTVESKCPPATVNVGRLVTNAIFRE
jgi:hypothetical protein